MAETVEMKPVAWRWRYERGDGKVHWTLTQREVLSQPAARGWCEIVAEPLYASPRPTVDAEEVEKLLVEHVRKINRVVAAGMHEGNAIREAAREILALLPAPGDRKAWSWLSGRPNLSLAHDYPDEEGEEGRWEVHRISGNINDREWELIATGATPLEAVEAARAALKETRDAE